MSGATRGGCTTKEATTITYQGESVMEKRGAPMLGEGVVVFTETCLRGGISMS